MAKAVGEYELEILTGPSENRLSSFAPDRRHLRTPLSAIGQSTPEGKLEQEVERSLEKS